MLARLTTRTARLLDVYFDPFGTVELEPEHHSEDPENSLVLDLHVLRYFLPWIPDNTLYRVADACGRSILPVCSNVQQTLSDDFDNVAQLMAGLEDSECSKPDTSKISVSSQPLTTNVEATCKGKETDFIQPPRKCRPRRCRRRSSNADLVELHRQKASTQLLFSSSNTSLPSIIVTPAPPQFREISCHVPYQDAAFGNLLTVPCHPAFNGFHPPMVPVEEKLPYLSRWKWEDGHWKAVVPTLAEQARNGLYSRSKATSRQKAIRSPQKNPPQDSV
ncbi:hypothetical protein CPC08DRAFT_765273 [Agrocybe pediades]|nr:hypothetical protein CPC08DRAFT_765273 [Agrocybe pediades]